MLPYALVMFACAAAGMAIAALFFALNGRSRGAVVTGGYALFFLGNAGSFFHTTRRGKFVEWERILDAFHLRGDEGVLESGLRARRGADRGGAPSAPRPGHWRRHLEPDRPVRQRSRRHAPQRGHRGGRRPRANRDRRHASASVPRRQLRSGRLEPCHPQHPRRRGPVPGHCGGLSRARAGRPAGNRGHPRHPPLRGCAAGPRRHRRGAPPAGWRFRWGNPVAATTLLTARKPEGPAG